MLLKLFAKVCLMEYILSFPWFIVRWYLHFDWIQCWFGLVYCSFTLPFYITDLPYKSRNNKLSSHNSWINHVRKCIFFVLMIDWLIDWVLHWISF
jgi:phage-related holin